MSYIKGMVNQLRKKHHTNNPFTIAKERNIIVLKEPLGKILGYYNYHRRFKFIHINNMLDENTQKFVCAHELGHAILHPKSNTTFLKENTLYSIDKIEVEANSFAVELLLTDDYISEFQDTNLTIQEIAMTYGIPKCMVHLKKF
ncbi:ImmA/IrrE family metallo-endopeptidase [Metabacillus idriensis]|uniref:ImmA/IrrE family metallo-endopeptidase n=1 Tax=Metabacillus idriensis TaxID=324768 RepID=UPI0017499077|nr:ImmA/IrrE family metallo-endopeptidase [Metabacillus idriensis]